MDLGSLWRLGNVDKACLWGNFGIEGGGPKQQNSQTKWGLSIVKLNERMQNRKDEWHYKEIVVELQTTLWGSSIEESIMWSLALFIC